MKKLAIGLLTVLAGIVAVSAAAVVPQQLAFAQQSNTVTATQSNSFTANVDQSISQNGGYSSSSASQGFCLQANQQNAAAGDDATNVGVNAIIATGGSSVNC
jgi:Tfp pilus assembly major pilin PilA